MSREMIIPPVGRAPPEVVSGIPYISDAFIGQESTCLNAEARQKWLDENVPFKKSGTLSKIVLKYKET